ncbi:hypothetical protein ACH5RR_003393 [Cinchona calisaya]|uniref:Uncharacterized protein n=1 Tax=Cinchona calisaya TaxID=153742 RepID=A0ABD3AUP1_9GENT
MAVVEAFESDKHQEDDLEDLIIVQENDELHSLTRGDIDVVERIDANLLLHETSTTPAKELNDTFINDEDVDQSSSTEDENSKMLKRECLEIGKIKFVKNYLFVIFVVVICCSSGFRFKRRHPLTLDLATCHDLCSLPSPREIKDAAFGLKPLNAPRLDGIHPILYLKY